MTMSWYKGFTLIELMIVVAIVGILASVAIPAYQIYTERAKVSEALTLINDLKIGILDYYKYRREFPANNLQAGVPSPDKIIGNYVKSAQIVDGAIHVLMGNKAGKTLDGELITIRPIVVIDSPTSPVSWVCGNAQAPEGMQTVGENRTSLASEYMPAVCRF